MDLSGLMEVLQQCPEAFQRRLELVLRQALEDQADGKLMVDADVSGRAPRRQIRLWTVFFKPTERPDKA